MSKKSFIIYQNWAKLIANLDDESAGVLIKAICKHSIGEETSIEDEKLRAIYSMIEDKLDEDAEKYSDVVKKRAEAVKKRWEKHSNEIQKATKVYKCNEMNSDTDTDTDTDTVINIKSREKRKRFSPPSLEEVTNYCNERQNGIDPQRFIDFYESKNWYVGKNKMVDWKACVRTWEGRRPKDQIEERTYDYDDLTKKYAKN